VGARPTHLRREDSALSGPRRARSPDLLYRLSLPQGGRLNLIFEHQARQDRDMLLRLLDEVVTLWRGAGRRAASGQLTAVYPVVVYQGLAPWLDATSLDARLDPLILGQATLRPSLMAFSYGLVDVQRLDLSEIRDPPALRLGLHLMSAAPSRDPWGALLSEAASLRSLMQTRGVDALRPHVNYAAEVARSEPGPQFARELAHALGYPTSEVVMSYATQLRREGRQEGLREGQIIGRQEGQIIGRQEGQIIGRRQMLLRLLERRFGPLSVAQTSRIDGADEAELERWTDRLLSGSTIDSIID